MVYVTNKELGYVRTKPVTLGKKIKNKAILAAQQNVRTKCLG